MQFSDFPPPDVPIPKLVAASETSRSLAVPLSEVPYHRSAAKISWPDSDFRRYLRSGGTTSLYDRRNDAVALDEIEQGGRPGGLDLRREVMMYQAGVVQVRREELLELGIKRLIALRWFIFMNQIISPFDARKERVSVGVGESRRETHIEDDRKTLPIAARCFSSKFEHQDAVDVRCVLNKELEISLACPHEFCVLCECFRRDDKPAFGFLQDMEELAQLCFEQLVVHEFIAGSSRRTAGGDRVSSRCSGGPSRLGSGIF